MEFKHLKIRPDALEAIKNYTLPEGDLGFGKVASPVMIVADHKDGKWGNPELVPYGPLNLLPSAKIFHYGQEVFEGMKAYYVDKKGPFLFRPEKNMERFNFSSRRMVIPEIPEEFFMESVLAITKFMAPFIPGNESGESLYIRPFSIGTEEGLGVAPSNSYKFIVIASPSSSYFTKGKVQIMIEREASRACIGGTGNAKTAGNYAASLISALSANENGYSMPLWLDALEKKYIEELSGMNLFCMINGELWTPKLTGTILSGITRDSLMVIAKKLGLTVREERMEISFLIDKIKSGECTEGFACGTAAIITAIEYLGETGGEHYKFNDVESTFAYKLKEHLLDIQEGRIESPVPEWITKVELT